MRFNIVQFLIPASIGFVLGTYGITWRDWQLHAVLVLAAAWCFAGYVQGWNAHAEKAKMIDSLRARMCKKGICPHSDSEGD